MKRFLALVGLAVCFVWIATGGAKGVGGAGESPNPPTAQDHEFWIQPGESVTVCLLDGAADPDGDDLEFRSYMTSQVLHGSVDPESSEVIGGVITYTPKPGDNAGDTFQYKISDGTWDATAWVIVHIGSKPQANTPPDAVNDEASTDEGVAKDVAVLDNDSDPDEDPLTVTNAGPAGHGTVVVLNGASVRYTPAPGFSGDDAFDYSISDGKGGADTATVRMTVRPANLPPTVNPGGPYEVDEGSDVVLTATGTDPEGQGLTYGWTAALDADAAQLVANGNTATFHGVDGPSNHTIHVSVTEPGPNGLIGTADAVVCVKNVPPTVGAIDFPVDPQPVGAPVGVTAAFTDPGVEDTHTAVWDWGDGQTSPGSISGTNLSGSTSANHVYAAAGVYTVRVDVTDKDGGTDYSVAEYVVIYNPGAGFVTGGGWIMAAGGAYPTNPALTGKATYGFVAKYHNGELVPEGNTEFQFHPAKMNFHSTSYDCLIVMGPEAHFWGSGTVNGVPGFSFHLAFIDGKLAGNGADKFRMKIWNNAGVVFDNQSGAEVYADPVQPTAGGNVVVHAK